MLNKPLEMSYDPVKGYYTFSKHPGHRDPEKYDLPEVIRKDWHRLNHSIEHKYEREHLKMQAYYNKLFPSLKSFDWNTSTYNARPFTLQEQERQDTGSGISANYMKAAIGMVVARLGNTSYDFKLIGEEPTLLYAIYKGTIERLFKSFSRLFNLYNLSLGVFHDAAVLNFSHVFIDPWSHKLRKVSDWEFGCIEAEFNENCLKRVMIRDFQFPVSALGPYIKDFDDKVLDELIRDKVSVDLMLYIDCFRGEKYVTINTKTSKPSKYPFETVQLVTYSWDVGTKRVTVESLFDRLYPLQRALNKLLAKKSQVIACYKGPVPVFNTNSDIITRTISNSGGEVLFLDGNMTDVSKLVTTIDPTPLSPELNAEAEALKGQIFELAGVEQISMDMENYRSAAAVIALDQLRDASFQSQVALLANFLREMLVMYVHYMAVTGEKLDMYADVEWKDIDKLLKEAYLDIKPVHNNGEAGGADVEPQDPNYQLIAIDRCILRVLRGQITFEDVVKDYTVPLGMVASIAAVKLMRLKAVILGVEADNELVQRLENFLVKCFVEECKNGEAVFANILETTK